MRTMEKSCKLLPAGTYYVGDPCYAIRDDDWSELLDESNYFEESPAVEFKGHWLVAFSTAYGDGEYRGSDGFAYGVDAGLVGAVPVELIDKETQTAIEEHKLGRIVKFAHGLRATTDGDGLLCFGDIVIDTREEEEEDEGHLAGYEEWEEDEDVCYGYY